jgi:heme oxygenase (biliverdin-producing, ferredoxin)
MNLSDSLKQKTSSIHQELESSPFVQKLFTGKLSSSEYYVYLKCLYDIYILLENKITFHKETNFIQPIYFTELLRSSSIYKDIQYISSIIDSSKASAPPLQSVSAYLNTITNAKDHRLVAHCYVRYLGDLSGGQMLKKIVQKNYANGSEQGINFYMFSIDNITLFKTNYKERMNSIKLSETEQTEVIEEAEKAFFCNLYLFQELGRISVSS